MANLLSTLLKEGWIKNYLDNLILWVPDFSTLMARLGKIFSLLMENGVILNLSKCEFGKRQVTFLGYQISEDGSCPDPKNVEVILEINPQLR